MSLLKAVVRTKLTSDRKYAMEYVFWLEGGKDMESDR